jgi:hypothetical protein
MGVKLELTPREEQRFGEFQNRVFRIFEPKREVVIGQWRKLLDKDLHNVFFTKYLSDQLKNEMGRTCSTHGEMRNAYKILDGKT